MPGVSVREHERDRATCLPEQLWDQARLAAVEATGLLNAEPERVFEDLAGLAARSRPSPIRAARPGADDHDRVLSALGCTAGSQPRARSSGAWSLITPGKVRVVVPVRSMSFLWMASTGLRARWVAA